MTYHLMESWGFLVFDIFGDPICLDTSCRS